MKTKWQKRRQKLKVMFSDAIAGLIAFVVIYVIVKGIAGLIKKDDDSEEE